MANGALHNRRYGCTLTFTVRRWIPRSLTTLETDVLIPDVLARKVQTAERVSDSIISRV